MTRKLSIELELNANDLDALERLLEQPERLAESVAAQDPRERSRMVHVLRELASAIQDQTAIKE
jgi:predicted transcriptional regulator